MKEPVSLPSGLLDDLREMIESTRRQVATAVNVALVILNWNLGQRIWREIMEEKRAAYGEQIVDAVSRQLAAEYVNRMIDEHFWIHGQDSSCRS